MYNKLGKDRYQRYNLNGVQSVVLEYLHADDYVVVEDLHVRSRNAFEFL